MARLVQGLGFGRFLFSCKDIFTQNSRRDSLSERRESEAEADHRHLRFSDQL